MTVGTPGEIRTPGVLHHAVRKDAEAHFAYELGLEVGDDMHAGGVVPDKERFAGHCGGQIKTGPVFR